MASEVEIFPGGRSYPFLSQSRQCRMWADAAGLHVLMVDGTVSHWTPGVDFVSATRYHWVVGSKKEPVLALLDADENEVLLIRVVDWLPEQQLVASLDKQWVRSRLPEVFAVLGIKVARNTKSYMGVPLLDTFGDPWLKLRGNASPGLMSLLLVRVLFCVAFAVFVTVGLRSSQLWGPVGAEICAAALIPIEFYPYWLRVRMDRASVLGSRVATPAPVDRVRRTFAVQAQVRRAGDRVGVVAGDRSERWLPLSGEGAVHALCLVYGDDSHDAPVAVAFVTQSGQVRAALPWRDWAAGRPGVTWVQELANRLGVAVQDGRTTAPEAVDLTPDLRSFSGGLPREALWISQWPQGYDVLYLVAVFSVLMSFLCAPLGFLGSGLVIGFLVARRVGYWGYLWYWNKLVNPPSEGGAERE